MAPVQAETRPSRRCALLTCLNTNLSTPKRKFFVIPSPNKDHEKAKLWIEAIRKINCTHPTHTWEPTKSSFVCSDHFQSGQHKNSRYENDYVPNVFDGNTIERPTPESQSTFRGGGVNDPGHDYAPNPDSEKSIEKSKEEIKIKVLTELLKYKTVMLAPPGFEIEKARIWDKIYQIFKSHFESALHLRELFNSWMIEFNVDIQFENIAKSESDKLMKTLLSKEDGVKTPKGSDIVRGMLYY